MSKWWDTLSSGEPRTVVLFQVDIKNHTDWLANEPFNFDAYGIRKTLAEKVTEELALLKFDRLSWAGDGGIFAAQLNGQGHPENICEAADAAMTIFLNWKEGKEVDFRITATLLRLVVDPEPGYWCGSGLNDFMKYERDIAITGGFVITESLHAELIDEKSKERFPYAHEIYFAGKKVKCYADTKYESSREPSPRSFGGWLRKNIKSMPPDAKYPSRKAITLEGNRLHSEDCTILDTAFDENGYRAEVLNEDESGLEISFKDEADKQKWQENHAALIKQEVEGHSMQLLRIAPEIGDDRLRIDYRAIPYREARAFHQIVMNDKTRLEPYLSDALQVTGEGTSLPNILSTAIMVIVGENEPEFIIANRKGRLAGYQGNSWAVSIGEQFISKDHMRQGKQFKRDKTFAGLVERGVREELLGKDTPLRMRISIHAFGLENIHNNFVLLSIADLRPLTFEKLAHYWQTVAEDRAEHTIIAALPAKKGVFEACMSSDSLPLHYWKHACDTEKVAFLSGNPNTPEEAYEYLPASAHQWQSTTPMRLAMTWWYSDIKKQLITNNVKG